MSEYIVNLEGELGMALAVACAGAGFAREEIVRCRDCTKFNEQEPNGEIGTCKHGLEDTGLVSIVEPDGFCAWGERRKQ